MLRVEHWLVKDQTFFLSHGSPTLSIDDKLEARQFFNFVISAHWDTEFPSVNTVPSNSTIHDFYGFPDPMYKVKELLMGGGGMKRVDEDTERGLDRGAWLKCCV
ncbi:hypothetical protein IGI04_030803 [Brassica rapa subsp. trilocularis]|uniref:Extradiol ring-cleavage dioxygenase class III enzyme subunit B domain-containing protein n=1 Tax=Brassica rapa subsp. trilocularis TaxID=1813537 RepID=A0ABQ7LSM9_BRACM|nr:hypothetical protein IGI04_030803 [Brassica rapa subsp. trilocularis]